jgi:hypothetical protein
MKTVFRMGVRCERNFPSNIQGLPTWYEFVPDGYMAAPPID